MEELLVANVKCLRESQIHQMIVTRSLRATKTMTTTKTSEESDATLSTK
jgi:hypothetical protein